jgi:hypothetical protein
LHCKSIILSNTYTSVTSNAACLTNVASSQPTDYLTQNLLPGQYFTANEKNRLKVKKEFLYGLVTDIEYFKVSYYFKDF